MHTRTAKNKFDGDCQSAAETAALPQRSKAKPAQPGVAVPQHGACGIVFMAELCEY
jgi:hypothetical protein